MQHCESLEDFYAAIGYGGVLLSRIMPRIKEDYLRLVKAENPSARNHRRSEALQQRRRHHRRYGKLSGEIRPVLQSRTGG